MIAVFSTSEILPLTRSTLPVLDCLVTEVDKDRSDIFVTNAIFWTRKSKVCRKFLMTDGKFFKGPTGPSTNSWHLLAQDVCAGIFKMHYGLSMYCLLFRKVYLLAYKRTPLFEIWHPRVNVYTNIARKIVNFYLNRRWTDFKGCVVSDNKNCVNRYIFLIRWYFSTNFRTPTPVPEFIYMIIWSLELIFCSQIIKL